MKPTAPRPPHVEALEPRQFFSADSALTTTDVQHLLSRAGSQALTTQAIAVVDREGVVQAILAGPSVKADALGNQTIAAAIQPPARPPSSRAKGTPSPPALPALLSKTTSPSPSPTPPAAPSMAWSSHRSRAAISCKPTNWLMMRASAATLAAFRYSKMASPSAALAWRAIFTTSRPARISFIPKPN